MTLPSSGQISLADAAAEFGLALPVTLPDSFYGKPGMPTSGPISLPGDFYGKSNVTFSPNGGSVGGTGQFNAGTSITCSQPAQWTYSGGGTGGTVSVANGGSASTINFGLSTPGAPRTVTWNVTGTAAGVTRNFIVTLDVSGSL